MLLLITIRLNDMISVKYSRFIIAVASVEAITSINREKIVTSRATTVTRQCISQSSQLNWITNDAYSPIVILGNLWVNKQQIMQCFSIMIIRDRFFISEKKNYDFESSLRIILYVMFSNSQKSLPRNSQNFGVIITKQNLHYLLFKIVVDCKSD